LLGIASEMTTIADFSFGRLEIGDLREERLTVDRSLAPPHERGDDVVGRHLLAVVELHALAQLDRVGEAVPRDRGHRFGEHRDGLVLLVERVETFEDVVRQYLGDRLCAPVRIE
jgi:hypothetical protein